MSAVDLLALPFEHLPPQAESTFEGHRAFGYDLPTAVADLVDNALTASARRVWFDFVWDGPTSTITVTDDGEGMSESELVAAMRLSSRNPREERAAHDLGRFGLGLKTASLSQAQRFTVRSRKRRGKAVTRCWDLELIAAARDWRLLKAADAAAEPHLARLAALSHGSAVVWQNLDRLTAGTHTNSDRDHQHFLRRVDEVRTHLSLVFHRLIGSGRTGVQLIVNNRPVAPWDPYLEDEAATYALAPTVLPLGRARVEVRPYVLPHLSKLSPVRHIDAAGSRGWNGHQGFYIYRNERLLVAGDWLGFFPRQDLYRLARIRVDLPNSMDDQWQIDVTKSRAVPPPALRDDLRRIADRTRAEARHIYTHRGAKLTPHADATRILLWEPRARHDKTFYRLNREHALVKAALREASDRPALNALLHLIEESIPTPHITVTNSEKPDHHTGPFEGVSVARIREVLNQLYLAFRAGGRSHADALEHIPLHPPFDLFPDLVGSLDENPPHA
jgi:hypothetical protein